MYTKAGLVPGDHSHDAEKEKEVKLESQDPILGLVRLGARSCGQRRSVTGILARFDEAHDVLEERDLAGNGDGAFVLEPELFSRLLQQEASEQRVIENTGLYEDRGLLLQFVDADVHDEAASRRRSLILLLLLQFLLLLLLLLLMLLLLQLLMQLLLILVAIGADAASSRRRDHPRASQWR
jgi:hypothetical protein